MLSHNNKSLFVLNEYIASKFSIYTRTPRSV